MLQRGQHWFRQHFPATNVDVIELACEGIEIKRKNATLPDRNLDMEARLVETLVAGRTMRGQITATEDRVKAQKTQLADAQLTYEKSANE